MTANNTPITEPHELATWDIALIDPPWPKKKGGIRKARPNQTRELAYRTMDIPAIFDLLDRDIFPAAEENNSVFLWGIDACLFLGEQAMKDRGYRLHARLVWDKCNGVAPAFSVRYCHEYLSWFYKPKFMQVSPESQGKISTVLRETARQHSRKPEIAYSNIEFWFPDLRKLDVFSRQSREGWQSFGDERALFDKD